MGHEAQIVTWRTSQPAAAAAAALSLLARGALVLAIVTLPWRQHLVLAARPFPPVYAAFTDLRLYTHQVFLLALLLLWAAGLLVQPRRLRSGPFFIWWPLLGLALAAAVSAVTAVDPLLAAYHAVQMAALLGLYLYVVNEIEGLGLIAAGAAGQLVAQSVVGVGQVWRQSDLGLAWLGERSLDPMGEASFVWAQGALRSLRAYGLSDHPNIMAAGVTFSLLVLLAWYLTTESRRRAAAAAVLAAGVLALFLTFSRPAWIALAAGVWGTAVFLNKANRPIRRRQWVPAAVIAALLLLPAVWLHLPYLQLGDDPDVIAARVQERRSAREEWLALNRAANAQFTADALTGAGLGGLPLALRGADFGYDHQPARVTLITAAAEIGLFGALLYVVVLAAPWLFLLLGWERLRANSGLAALYGLLLALVIFGFYDAYLWSYADGRLWQWLAWSLWAAAAAK